MKRLFMLRHSKGGSVVVGDSKQPLYFHDKQDAKKLRNTMGGNVVVTLGPDHRLYKEGK